MRCDDIQQEIALSLLTGAELPEALQGHIATCPTCSAEQASLRGVAQLLPRLTLDEVTARPVVTEGDLLPRLLQRVVEERQRQRRNRRLAVASTLALAAAVLVIALASLGGVLGGNQHAIMASATANGIQATAAITPSGSGSSLALSIKGVPRGTRCILRVESTSAAEETLTVWTADYYGAASTSGRSAFPPDEIARVTVSRVGGPLLLAIPVAT